LEASRHRGANGHGLANQRRHQPQHANPVAIVAGDDANNTTMVDKTPAARSSLNRHR
jgi:hypothetical protein